MNIPQSDRFCFRNTDVIGAASAEDDGDMLEQCFVDTGDLRLLSDPGDNHVVVLGRTGTGKTALFKKLASAHGERVIYIDPEDLALTYIANSNVLKSFEELGVNLDPFYKLLWRHVFTVEFLARYFAHHPSDKDAPGLFDKLRSLVSGTARNNAKLREAVNYLETWGQSYWCETEYRVKLLSRRNRAYTSESAGFCEFRAPRQPENTHF